MTSNKFYFNVHKAGKTHKSGNPVCAGPAKAGVKAPKGFAKKYTKKWPHCSNIKCADKTPITKMATECAKNKLCSGFSFSTGVSTGHGCLKKCGAKETGGYGSGGYDYWVKKPAAKPKYSYAGTGKNSCASVKKKPITTEAGCKAAAKALKKTYAGKGSYSTWQKACFMTSNKFYFNVHKAGKTHKSGNPVCAGPAKAGVKAPKGFAKKYTKKWPHCSNIKCADKTPITKMATECAKNKLCSGFSFSTGVSTGHGCLKKCGAKETGGYGSGG